MNTPAIEAPQGEPQEPQQSQPTSHRGRFVDGKVEDLSGHNAWSSDSIREEAIAQGDWVRTAGVAPSEMTPDTIVSVRVGGMVTTMEARSAERLGAIRRGVHGYETIQQTQQQAQQTATPNQPNPEAEEAKVRELEDQSQVYRPSLMNQEAEAAYAKAIDGISPGYHAQLAEALTSGDGMVPEGLAKEIAATMPGVQPEEVQAKARAAIDLLADQVHTTLGNRHNTDGGELAARFRDVMPVEFKKAVNLLATQRSMRGFDALSQRYVEGLDKFEPNTVLRFNHNGWRGQRVEDEIRIVGPKGQVYSWAEALIRGVVKVNGHKNGK